MQKRRFGIKETGTTFTTGVVFIPSWEDVNAVVGKMYTLGLIKDLVPEVNISVILAHRGAMKMTVPLILERAYAKDYRNKAPFEVQALLWVLACFWYRFGGGPHPAPKQRVRLRKRDPIMSFRCPFCYRVVYEPNPRYKDRGVILKQFANALTRHGEECAKLLYLDVGVRK